jgi:hypothetical protein
VFFKDAWHYIALTVDENGNFKGYVNGKLGVSYTSTTFATVRDDILLLRSDYRGVTFYPFRTYQFGAYKKTFTADEVEQKNALLGPAPTSAFGGPNLVSAIPDIAVLHGGSKSFNVTSHFNATKTPASTFKYFVTTNNNALLEVRNHEDGTFELVSRNTSGIATAMVKAVAVERDVDVWAATSTFTVSVVVDEHDPTRTTTVWPDVSGPHTLDLTEYFADLDGVEQLTFEATVSNASVVSAVVVNGTFLNISNVPLSANQNINPLYNTYPVKNSNVFFSGPLILRISGPHLLRKIVTFWRMCVVRLSIYFE